MTPPKGYKHTELGVLPEDWEVVRLGDVCEIQMCKRIFSHQTRQDFEIPFFKIGTLGGTPDAFISRDLFELYRNKYNFPQKGEVMITCSGTIGRCIQYDGKDAYFQDSNIVWLHNQQGEVLSNNFAFIALSNQDWSMLSSTTITRLYTTDLKKIQIPLPPLAEQEKIAEILSTWDTQIQNFETLIAEKQALKKGLCQTLLTAKTRLKGFSEDWEVVRLGDVCEICNGFAFQSKNFKESGSPIVRISNIKSNNTISLEDMVYFSFDDYKNKNLNKFAIYQNDILVALSGATTGKIGKLKEDVVLYLNQRIGKFQPSERLNSDFLFQCLLLQSDFILLLSGGGAQPNLSTTTIKDKVLISLPPLAEQEKIAEILSEVDNEITLLEQKLESLKSQKRGLMQKLLNGKVRVKI